MEAMNNASVPFEEHRRVVAIYEGRIDQWVERYTTSQEHIQELITHCYTLAGQARVLKHSMELVVTQLEVRVREMEEVLHAHFSD